MSIKDQVTNYFNGTMSSVEDYDMLIRFYEALEKAQKATENMLAVEARKINRAIGAKDEYVN